MLNYLREGMDKRAGVLAAVIVVVAVVLIVAFIGPNISKQSSQSNTTIVLNSTTITTTTNAVTTIRQGPSTTTIRSYQGCLSSTPTVPINNGGFSTGNFIGWNVSGDGFGSAPLNITFENSNAVIGTQSNNNYTKTNLWTGYNGNFFASTYQGGLTLTPGNLTSDTFEVTEPYLNFQIASPQDNNIYVEILKNGVPQTKSYYNTFSANNNNYHAFMNASIPIATLMCSNVSIRVVADVVSTPATHYDFVAIGDFYLSRNPPSIRTNPVNQTILGSG